MTCNTGQCRFSPWQNRDGAYTSNYGSCGAETCPCSCHTHPQKQVVLTLELTDESQQIVEHPEQFWITSMSGVAFSKFAVGVREVE